MKGAAQLLAETALSVDDTTYFRLGFEVDGSPVPGSLGSDRFHLNAMILPGKRVAATGRMSEYGVRDTPTGIGFGALEARPAEACSLPVGRNLVVTVENNIALDPAQFVMDFSIALVVEEGGSVTSVDINLRRPDIRMSWPSRGLFQFDVTDALAMRVARR